MFRGTIKSLNLKSILILLFVSPLWASPMWVPSTAAAANSAPPYRLRVVYVIASDRQPHPDYAARLDYFLKKVQEFYARHMKAGGYVDGMGNGLTFQLETDFQGKVIVHLIDHRPGGNAPDPAKTAESYRWAWYKWETETDQVLGPDFRANSAVFAITECTDVIADNGMSYGWHYGGGDSGPGLNGYLTVSDHIFGNDVSYTMPYQPLIFNTMGRNDEEQLEILRDARFTNLNDGSRVYNRGVPVAWQPGELPSANNQRVWEWASIYLGVTVHELGHTFGLKHCYRFTPGKTGTYPGDYNVMGNGFRKFYQSMFPEELFAAGELYPQLAVPPVGFGEGGAILNPVQLRALNRNQFFHGLEWDADRVRPVIERTSVQYNPTDRTVTVNVAVRDGAGADTSGLSHITYMLDWLAHQAEDINAGPASGTITRQDILDWNVWERANSAHMNNMIGRGLHRVIFEPMDYAGNPPVWDWRAVVWFGVDEYYIEHWLLWSEYFDAYAKFGYSATYEQQLRYAWLGTPDASLNPQLPDSPGILPRWRYFPTGPHLDMVAAIHRFFDDTPDWSVRRVAYAATRLHSNRTRPLRFRMGYSDFAQVILNGEEIYAHSDFNAQWDPLDASHWVDVPVTLQAGENLLLVKLYNDSWGSAFMVWFNESDGRAVPVEVYPPDDPDIISVIVPARHGILLQ